MQALNFFVFCLGVSLACTVCLGALIVAFVVWWYGPADSEEGDE